MTRLRVALGQVNPRVGDLNGNVAKVREYIRRGREAGAELIVFPELVVTGYPPEDLLLKPEFIREAEGLLLGLGLDTRGIICIVGGPRAEEDLYNAAYVFHDGVLAGVYKKRYLPNYGVFDEYRYFRSARENLVFDLQGVRIGVSVCEDIWVPGGPHQQQANEGGAEILINISSSPYHVGKGQERERMLATRAADNAAFVLYCNLVGAQDELVFDGHSLILDPSGHVVGRGAQFSEDLILADIDASDVLTRRLRNPRGRLGTASDATSIRVVSLMDVQRLEPDQELQVLARNDAPMPKLQEISQALILGVRDYVLKNGFEKVVIGLSGGIDSSLVAWIAVQAVGAENVVGVSMPSRYSSDHSLEDARALASNLGFDYRVIGIEMVFEASLNTLSEQFEGLEEDTTEENLQARIRGTILMALSNKFGWLVLTTGNKSETAVGYSTLYGDTAGGFGVIKDVPKTMVYDICKWINDSSGSRVIPHRVIDKPPSAELRPDQVDTESLPPYEELDPILQGLIDEGLSVEALSSLGHPLSELIKVSEMVDRSEYKRRQSPPGIKVFPRAFGKDWRLPITNAFRPVIKRGE